jgi:predicted DNA-binding transcriptional regulator AlpA
MGKVPPRSHHTTKKSVAAEPPRIAVGGPRLIDRHELLAKTALSYPKIWALMREGTFPRARAVGGRTLWLESEIDAWIANLPQRAFKGDAA